LVITRGKLGNIKVSWDEIFGWPYIILFSVNCPGRLLYSSNMSARTTRLLTDWSFTQVGIGEVNKINEWLPVSSFPTTVHVELLKLNKIPDPVSFFIASGPL